MVPNFIALAIAISIGVCGQILIKAGSLNAAHEQGYALLQPFIILGLFCYFTSALFYIYALKQIPVSIAFPCVSISYIAVALLAHLIWNEPFGLQHMLALLLIISGVFVLVKA